MDERKTSPVAYRIETARVTLRCFDPTDAPAVKALIDRNRAALATWLELGDEPEALEAMIARLLAFRAAFDTGERFHYAAFVGERVQLAGSLTVEPIGGRGLLAGGWMDPALGGDGLASEALTAVCQLAFETRAARFIELRIRTDNAPSRELAARTGFTYEATLAGRVWVGGVAYDEMIWTLTREQMPASIGVRAFDVLGHRFI